jgi:hypothetical protein
LLLHFLTISWTSIPMGPASLEILGIRPCCQGDKGCGAVRVTHVDIGKVGRAMKFSGFGAHKPRAVNEWPAPNKDVTRYLLPGTLCPWAGSFLCLVRDLPAGVWLMELQVPAGTPLYITALKAPGGPDTYVCIYIYY